MFINILKSVIKNFQIFLIIWVILLILNQLFIFRGCFEIYCLLAGLPHTGVIAALVTFFSIYKNSDLKKSDTNNAEYKQIKDIKSENLEDESIPFCPKCGSVMRLRTAKQGKYIGKKFWGCSDYPKCNSILNL